MSYTKTTWVNNTTPINDTNLNKIEQGIYDNSLVVDAITNTINPTDTETYKTAELTEGQITDVIGVNDIIIKGDTSQNGEPTPSSPVDINVVSGSNVVNIENENNKNLFDGIFRQGTHISSVTSNRIINKNILEAKIGKTYTLSTNLPSIYKWKITNNEKHEIADSVRTINDTVYSSTSSVTVNCTENGYLRVLIARIDNGNITPNDVANYKFQVEKGSTATTYEPHQGKELPLDLGKNLANIDDIQLQKNWQNVADTTRASIVNIKVKPSTTYTLSSSYTSSSITNVRCVLFGAIGDTTHKGVVSGTFTTTSTTHYLSIEVIANTTFTQSMLNGLKIQLEKGDTATTYVPYDPDPIELCKIGDYQDYFYKSGSKWYLHKEIIKNVFNGTENDWDRVNTNTEGQYRFMNRTLENIILNPSDNGQIGKILNNLLINQSANYNYTCNDSVAISQEGSVFVYYSDINNYTISEFRNWLTTHNLILYCVLKTPTNTEITDTTLISQLEAIYNAPLYEQTNITQENNDLPMVLDITACKDNINGIKVFIRK